MRKIILIALFTFLTSYSQAKITYSAATDPSKLPLAGGALTGPLVGTTIVASSMTSTNIQTSTITSNSPDDRTYIMNRANTAGAVFTTTGQLGLNAFNGLRGFMQINAANDHIVIYQSDGAADLKYFSIKYDSDYVEWFFANDLWNNFYSAMKFQAAGADMINGYINSAKFAIGTNALSNYGLLVQSVNNMLLRSDDTWSSGDSPFLYLGDENAWINSTWGAGVDINAFNDAGNNITFSHGGVKHTTFTYTGDIQTSGDVYADSYNTTGQFVTVTTLSAAAVQTAIDSLTTGTVYCPQGRYDFTDASITMKDTIKLIADSTATVFDASGGQAVDTIIVTNCDYIEIRNIQIIGNPGGGASGDCISGTAMKNSVIENVLITGCDDEGIVISGGACDDNKIINNSIYDSDGLGMLVNGSRNTIEGNVSNLSGGDSFNIGDSNNTITNNESISVADDAFIFASLTLSTVDKNRVTNCEDIAYSFTSGGQNVIVNNKASGSSGKMEMGISLNGTDECTIANNKIFNCGDGNDKIPYNFFNAFGNTITGNTAINSLGVNYDKVAFALAGTCYDNTFIGNKAKGTNISAVSESAASYKNKFLNNDFDDLASGAIQYDVHGSSAAMITSYYDTIMIGTGTVSNPNNTLEVFGDLQIGSYANSFDLILYDVNSATQPYKLEIIDGVLAITKQ